MGVMTSPRLSVSDALVPLTNPADSTRWLGDYNGISGNPILSGGGVLQPRFFAAWADEFDLPGVPTVAGAFVEAR